MLVDLASTLTRLTDDVLDLVAAASPQPSDEQSPRGTAELAARLRGDREAIANAVQAAGFLSTALADLQAIASKPASATKAAKKATARKR